MLSESVTHSKHAQSSFPIDKGPVDCKCVCLTWIGDPWIGMTSQAEAFSDFQRRSNQYEGNDRLKSAGKRLAKLAQLAMTDESGNRSELSAVLAGRVLRKDNE